MLIKNEKFNRMMKENNLYDLQAVLSEFPIDDEDGMVDTKWAKDEIYRILDLYESSDNERGKSLSYAKLVMKDTEGGTIVPLNESFEPKYTTADILHSADVICEYYRMKYVVRVIDIMFIE